MGQVGLWGSNDTFMIKCNLDINFHLLENQPRGNMTMMTMMLLVRSNCKVYTFSNFIFQIIFSFASGHWDESSETSQNPSLRNMVLKRIPTRFHESLRGFKIKLTAELSDPQCLIRIAQFEFRCKNMLTVLLKTKNLVDTLKSESTSPSYTNPGPTVIVVIALSIIFVLALAISLFYCVYIKRNTYVCEPTSSVCVPTTSCV